LRLAWVYSVVPQERKQLNIKKKSKFNNL